MKRCTATNSQRVRCVKPGEHYEHTGWMGEQEVTWNTQPVGPTTDIGYEAAAWALTDTLGLEVTAARDLEFGERTLVIDGDDMRKWWDKNDEQILRSWESHIQAATTMQPASPTPPLMNVLREQSQDRLSRAAEDGRMASKRLVDICLLPGCGCDGEAHS